MHNTRVFVCSYFLENPVFFNIIYIENYFEVIENIIFNMFRQIKFLGSSSKNLIKFFSNKNNIMEKKPLLISM